MSTTTPPAEITVPREFLPDLVRITTIQLEMQADGIPQLSGELADRSVDDAVIAVIARLIGARVALLAALDDGTPVDREALTAIVPKTVSWVHEEAGDNDRSLDSTVERAGLARDLNAWAVEHGLVEREAVTA